MLEKAHSVVVRTWWHGGNYASTALCYDTAVWANQETGWGTLMYIIMNRDRRALAYGTIGLMESTQGGTSLKGVQTSLEKGGRFSPQDTQKFAVWPCWSGPGGCWGRQEVPPGVQARDLGKQQPALRLSWPGSHPSGCPGHMEACRGSPEAGRNSILRRSVLVHVQA